MINVWAPPDWQDPPRLRQKQDAAAVMYPAFSAGHIPAGPDEIRWPTPHYSQGLEVQLIIQAWWVTVRPVCHHFFTYLAQPQSRPSVVEIDNVRNNELH